MSTPRDRDSDALLETQMLRINRLCNEFEAGWQAGRPRALEDVLSELSGADWQAALQDLLPLEIEYRQRAGETVTLNDYAERFPNADQQWLASLFYSTQVTSSQAVAVQPVPEKLGDYQIIGRIGGGGMGTVYKALHVRMGRVVALKVLRPEIQQNPVLIQRFNREVRVAARLTHPNIVAALDAREQDGVHFLITEFIEGLDLEATLRSSGPLPVAAAAAVDCVLQAARGLDYAHRQGVVHRDIKPANLLRDQRGVVKVLDMGLARLDADTGATSTDLTNSGMVLGTAAYMAPEQARDVHRADARSDIYSLGCTLFYLLTGRHPFTGATALDTVLSHLNQPIPTLNTGDAAFPVELERIFARMVAKDPEDRFQTAAELVTALEGLRLTPHSQRDSGDRSTAAIGESDAPTFILAIDPDGRNPSKESRRSSRYGKQPGLWIGGGLALLVAGVLIAWLFPDRDPVPDPKPIPVRKSVKTATGRHVLSFNGTSSYLVAPSLIPEAGGTYTLEAFVAPGADNRNGNVISWLGPDWMAVFISDGRWGLARLINGESHLIHSDQLAPIGVPVHLAGIFRGSDLRLFVNGQPVTPVDMEYGLVETTGGLHIGGIPFGLVPSDHFERFFNGRIHSVRITRGARYTTVFAPPKAFDSDSRTLALYHFDTPTESDLVKDASSHGHDAQLHDVEWTLNER